MFKEVHVDDIESRAGAPQIATLLAHYRSLAAGGALPSYSDINAERFCELAHNLAVVEPVGEGDYLYLHYGRAIVVDSGFDMLGSRVSELKSEIGAFFCAIYDRALAERRPIYTGEPPRRGNHRLLRRDVA